MWPALVEPARLADWFPSAVTIDLRPGGAVTFGDVAQPGVVTDLDPPRLIAYTWDTDHLRWELRPDGDGTLLTLTHTFDDRAGAASFASGWHTCVAALRLALDGHPGDPGVDHWALHERYLAELLEHAVAGGGRMRWELRAGTGHGARLVLVRGGPPGTAPDAPDRAPAQVAALLALLPGRATSGTPVA